MDEGEALVRAGHPATTWVELQALARHPSVEVRLLVAANRSTARDTLRELEGDPDPFVKLQAWASRVTR